MSGARPCAHTLAGRTLEADHVVYGLLTFCTEWRVEQASALLPFTLPPLTAPYRQHSHSGHGDAERLPLTCACMQGVS